MSVSSSVVDFASAFPGSRKDYVSGECAGHRLAVPVREIALAGGETLRVYDTSGPQGCDVRQGLPLHREAWIAARGDVDDVTQTFRPAPEGPRSGAPSLPSRRVWRCTST